MTGEEIEALKIADQVIQVFELQPDDAKVSIQNLCAQQRVILVSAVVRGKAHVAKGICTL